MSNDTIYRQAAIEALYHVDEYNGRSVEAIRNLPPAQAEPAIPLSWIEGKIKWLKSLDNSFSPLTAGQISAMVNKWKDEQHEIDKPDEKN